MHGQTKHADPGRYAVEIDVMQEMGWGWRELCECPAPVLEELRTRLQARRHYERLKADQEAAKARSKTKHG